MEPKRKILIDTDIGDDIDDAFALLAAMASGFEIVGITTVFRNTDARARMAKKLLHAFGHGYENVPVYAGYSTYTPDKESNTEHMCRFEEDLSDPALTPENTNPEDAVDFILDCCRRHGKELSILAIGPFCNIAKAIGKDPQSIKAVGQVVIMGGAYFKQYADWNVMCDVPAADVMFRGLSNLVCIGADVTHRLSPSDFLRNALRDSTYSGNIWEYVRQQYQVWQADYPESKLILHDVLTVYYVLDPSVCALKEISVRVIPDGFAKGMTLNADSYGKASLNSAYRNCAPVPRVLAAWDVDLAKFHDMLCRDILRCTGHNC